MLRSSLRLAGQGPFEGAYTGIYKVYRGDIRVSGLGLKVWDLGFSVWSLGFCDVKVEKVLLAQLEVRKAACIWELPKLWNPL